MNRIDTLLGSPPAHRQGHVEALSWLVAGTVLVALVLFALQQALRLPAHFGVEDWLGWRNADTLQATLTVWGRGQSRLPAATAYLLIDTALFMPLYGFTLLWATRQVHGTLQADGPADWLVRFLRGLAVPAVLALWCVDAVENLGGLARLGIGWGWGLGALLLAGPALLLLRRWAGTGSKARGRLAIAWLAASLLGTSLAAWLLPTGTPDATGLFNGQAHLWKPAFMAAAVLPPLGLWLCWWFGLDLDSRPGAGRHADAEIRSACRQVAAGVVGRSRYVLAVLAGHGRQRGGAGDAVACLLAVDAPGRPGPAQRLRGLGPGRRGRLGRRMGPHLGPAADAGAAADDGDADRLRRRRCGHRGQRQPRAGRPVARAADAGRVRARRRGPGARADA
jgi:hypothetical protein